MPCLALFPPRRDLRTSRSTGLRGSRSSLAARPRTSGERPKRGTSAFRTSRKCRSRNLTSPSSPSGAARTTGSVQLSLPACALQVTSSPAPLPGPVLLPVPEPRLGPLHPPHGAALSRASSSALPPGPAPPPAPEPRTGPAPPSEPGPTRSPELGPVLVRVSVSPPAKEPRSGRAPPSKLGPAPSPELGPVLVRGSVLPPTKEPR
mmetsp:Transcript_26616/g.79474  ORF Transcript_26616/g.79474 Transcript_26616/m.79474 type:complete len:205 (+) Transcript_26616:140-754(+)